MKRGQWLLDFIEEMERSKYTVHMRRFTEFLGRPGFLSHLSPLYSWSSALDQGTMATAPRMVRLVMKFIGFQLRQRGFWFGSFGVLRWFSLWRLSLAFGFVVAQGFLGVLLCMRVL